MNLNDLYERIKAFEKGESIEKTRPITLPITEEEIKSFEIIANMLNEDKEMVIYVIQNTLSDKERVLILLICDLYRKGEAGLPINKENVELFWNDIVPKIEKKLEELKKEFDNDNEKPKK